MFVAFHEAGHVVARLAHAKDEEVPPPMLKRVVARPRKDWGTPFTRWRGDGARGLSGTTEMDMRVLMATIPSIKEGHPELAASLPGRIWRDAIEYLAGPVAEAQAKHQKSSCAIKASWHSTDLENARECLEAINRADDFDLLWRETWVLVRRHWPAVLALGKALQDRHELDGEEAEDIVFEAMPELRYPESPE
jgi:hypothetical protein